jgi:hypothetical protein
MLLSSGGFANYRAESNVFNLLVPKFGNLRGLGNKRRLLKAWFETEMFRRSGLTRELLEARVLAECRNGGDFLRIVMEEIARSQNVERWAECTPDHLLYLPSIKTTIPEALVIHIIRDGRDVALSLNKQGWIRPFTWDSKRGLLVAGLFWSWIVAKGRKYGRGLTPDYMEVHFEDLVAQPRETLAKLGRFIDHDLDYDRIQRAGVGSVLEPNTSFIAGSQETGFNPVGRWRNGFSREGLAMFEGLVGSYLEELGYGLATPSQGLPNTLELKAMRSFYHLYFDSKHYLKSHTPLGKLLVHLDLSSL